MLLLNLESCKTNNQDGEEAIFDLNLPDYSGVPIAGGGGFSGLIKRVCKKVLIKRKGGLKNILKNVENHSKST